LERPSERSKHDDVLFEMQPLKDVGMEIHAEYEVAGLGIGNTTCYWKIDHRLVNIVFDCQESH